MAHTSITDIRNITSSNLIATTKSGDHNNKLIVGAHSDGVLEGPAINDVASGLVGVYEVAKGLSKY
jgi:aminopeptidase Y